MLPGLAPLDRIDRGEMHLVIAANSGSTFTSSKSGFDLDHLRHVQGTVLPAARDMGLTLRLSLLGRLWSFDGGCRAVKIHGLGRLQDALDGLDAVRESADLCIRKDGEHRGW